MTSKIYCDPEFGTVVLRKNARSRAISIRVRGSEGREGGRVSVTVPWSLRYQDGISYLDKRRKWVREALDKQDSKASADSENGHAIGRIVSGTNVRTLLSEIVFKAEQVNADVTNGSSSLRRTVKDNEKVRVRIRRTVVENPSESGRLWLGLDKPINVKVIEYPQSLSSEASGGMELAGAVSENKSLTGETAEMSYAQAALKKVLVEVLREEAKLLLPQKAALFAEQYGFKFRNLTIKHNSSNWGSCSRAGNINLNLNLVRLPEPLCDYVILHELCHLKEPNHGSRFHTLLEALCLCNIRHLLSLGSPDAEKYIPWLDAAAAVKSDLSRTFKRAAYKAGMLDINTRNNSQRPSTSPSPLTPLDEVLSRETAKWRLI